MIRSAPSGDRPTLARYDDSFVELVAWWWTEGDYSSFTRSGTHYGRITQSPTANPAHCDAIARAFEKCYGPAVDTFPRAGRTSEPMWRVDDEDADHRRFIYSAAIGEEFNDVAPGGVVSREFLNSLTTEQVALFIDVSIKADGSVSRGGQIRLSQRSEERADRFAFACILAGLPVSYRRSETNNMTIINIGHNAYVKPRRPGITTAVLDVGVWCPTVDGTSTWLARRDGTVYFTGNSGTPELGDFDHRYGIDEMMTWQERMQVCRDGIAECVRVVRRRGMLLVKCQNQVSSGAIRWQVDDFTRHAEAHGMRKMDEFYFMGGSRGQPKTRPHKSCAGAGCDSCDNGVIYPVQRHAYMRPSMLLVFRKVGR